VLNDAERYIPSEEQYLEAFHSIYEELTPGHKAILNKLYQHCYFMINNRRLRTWELSQAAGYNGDSSGQIGILGAKFCKFLELEYDEFRPPALAIVNWFADEVNGYWYIELIPEAARAFKRFRLETVGSFDISSTSSL
jgi:glutaredoxin 2